MLLLTVGLLQSAAATADGVPLKPFDLGDIRLVAPCAAAAPDDIVVCGTRRNDRYRLPPLDTARYEPNRKAEIGVKENLIGAAEVESATIAPGMRSNRMMLRLKLSL